MNENGWVPVPGFPGYSVNPLGKVRNDADGNLLQTRINQYGVAYVGLTRDGRQHGRSLPLLVANIFVPRPNEFWDTPINLDGDRTNCRADNLVWRPRRYAVQYNNQFEDRYEHPINAPVREAETDDEFPNSMAAACHYGLLEREIVLSILNNTITWPTYQRFVIAD